MSVLLSSEIDNQIPFNVPVYLRKSRWNLRLSFGALCSSDRGLLGLLMKSGFRSGAVNGVRLGPGWRHNRAGLSRNRKIIYERRCIGTHVWEANREEKRNVRIHRFWMFVLWSCVSARVSVRPCRTRGAVRDRDRGGPVNTPRPDGLVSYGPFPTPETPFTDRSAGPRCGPSQRPSIDRRSTSW